MHSSSAAINTNIKWMSSSPIYIRLSLEVTCYYWCWCSMLRDLIIPVDSLSISLGMGLSITLKAGVKLPGWLWGAVVQWPEHLQLKLKVLGSIPRWPPWVFSLPAGLLYSVDGMKDLWYSSTAWLLSTQIWMEDLWCSSTVRLLST